MDSYNSSFTSLKDACPCEWKEIKADLPIYCIKCVRKAYKVPYLIEQFGEGLYGFRIPTLKVSNYSVDNPNQVIYDGEGNIIGICDVFNPEKLNPCDIKCLHEKCGFSINLKTLLTADCIVGRTDNDGYHLKMKEEFDHVNQLKKERGNGQIVFYKNKDDHWKNYHNYGCVSGFHCHCMFDRNPMKSFRSGVMNSADRGNGRSVWDLVYEFSQMKYKRVISTELFPNPAEVFPVQTEPNVETTPAAPIARP